MAIDESKFIINGRRVDLSRDDISPVYKGEGVFGDPLLVFENLGIMVTVDDEDNIFVKNKISGIVVKLEEIGGGISAKKIGASKQQILFNW